MVDTLWFAPEQNTDIRTIRYIHLYASNVCAPPVNATMEAEGAVIRCTLR
ncbi:hypothetical protein [Cohaesibacter marisflavi]|nr:hypothetical protein [Cohaesibacter marisflavi]